MQKLKKIIHRSVLYALVVIFAGGAPLSVAGAESAPTGNFTHDSSTGHWDSKTWRWDPVAGKYVRNESPSPSPEPTTATTTDPSPSPSPSVAPESTSTSDTATNAASGGGDATVNQNTNASDTQNVNNNADVTNNLDSNSKTGNADVRHNTRGGDATTGNAGADTTIINTVHSTVNSGDIAGVAHFTTNLYGDITGDITIGPSIQNAQIDRTTNLNSATNVNNNNTLTNNQTLKAASGDAAVTGNTTGGNATSGNANTVADVVNLINTLVSANKSFVGTINIYGNLNGDILVSPDFIPQLLASNAQVYGNYTMPLSTTVNDDQSIVNNVKLNAASGTATVANNTSAGSATTGNAQTNLTILNLTGHQVNAAKSLLVFVNVLGTWVGMIVDAPGATAAALGSGVISDTTTVTNTANLNNNAKITNNLDLSALSGDATVAGNTQGGNATTGNATASANIANISTSEFNLSDWFGVLFINVFGTWIGSFGVDTSAGTIVPLSGSALPSTPAAVVGAPNLRFGYRSTPHTGTPILPAGVTGSGGGIDTTDPAYAAVLASTRGGGGTSSIMPTLTPIASPRIDPFSTIMMVTGLTIVGGSSLLWALRRWLAFRSAPF
jgi:hypothetical protein